MDLDHYAYRLLATAATTLIAVGTFFFHAVEKWSWLNSYYFCIVTLTTVGYGDIVPKTPLGKFATTIYILLGVGIIAAFFQATLRRRELKNRQNRNK